MMMMMMKNKPMLGHLDVTSANSVFMCPIF